MPNPYFRFKQFTVWHDRCAMKVGTDGVLLGAWTTVDHARRILDIGTGTGLIALMLAQRCPADTRIVAIDIDEAAASQAAENVGRSPWDKQIEVLSEDFRTYRCREKFDVIVSNPPYFVDSLTCPDAQRNAARHNDSLTYKELVAGAASLLSASGTFNVVIPTDVAERVETCAITCGLSPIRKLHVMTKPSLPPKRMLIAFSFVSSGCLEDELIIELARHQYSDAYIALTRDYYLKM